MSAIYSGFRFTCKLIVVIVLFQVGEVLCYWMTWMWWTGKREKNYTLKFVEHRLIKINEYTFYRVKWLI